MRPQTNYAGSLLLMMSLMGGICQATDIETNSSPADVVAEISNEKTPLSLNEKTPSVSNEKTPLVKAKFYSTYATGLIPRLQELRNFDPECNKIVFKLENYPTNQEIVFEVKRSVEKSGEANYAAQMSFTILEDGSIVSANGQETLKYIVSSSRGYLPGERVFYRFRTSDGSLVKEVSGIPNPITFKDEHGQVAMSAELLTASPTVYLIDFPTMAEGEEYELKSTSVGETTKAKTKYTTNTPIHYTPAVRGKSKGGLGVLEVKRKNGELYLLRLPWGMALSGPVVHQKAYPSH